MLLVGATLVDGRGGPPVRDAVVVAADQLGVVADQLSGASKILERSLVLTLAAGSILYVVVQLLGAPKFLDEEMEERTKDPGVAIGLAWTPAGGEALFVEAAAHLGDELSAHARVTDNYERTGRGGSAGPSSRWATTSARSSPPR